jgi:hypothetical protein
MRHKPEIMGQPGQDGPNGAGCLRTPGGCPQALPACWRHPRRRCPGECQYLGAPDDCWHDLAAAAAKACFHETRRRP